MRSHPSPIPPLRRHKHRVPPEDAVPYWNHALAQSFVVTLRYGLILLGLVLITILTNYFLGDDVGLRTVIFAVIFLSASYPIAVIIGNIAFLILFGPSHFFTWLEYKQKHDWEQMNLFYRSRTNRRLLQEEAIQKKAERLVNQGAAYHIGSDGEIIFDEKPKHRK